MNFETLSGVHQYLGPNCSVSLRYEKDYFGNQHADEIHLLRRLARSLRYQIRQAVAAHNFDRAIAVAATLFGLGNAVRRGGLIMDSLVSLAITSCGLEPLIGCRQQLQTEQMERLLRELHRAELEREEFRAVLIRDAEWSGLVEPISV